MSFKDQVAQGAAWNIVWKHAQVLPMVEFKRKMFDLGIDLHGLGMAVIVDKLSELSQHGNRPNGEMCTRYGHCGCWEVLSQHVCCVCGA